MHSPVSGSQTSAPVQLQVWLHPAPYVPELHTESHQTTVKSQNVLIYIQPPHKKKYDYLKH